ncbi:hypothetical protein GCM10025866_08030 [Naasia aerilata]|uniref:Uncharacterized protein n=1 Tax=Naasia aerilata TaxID=1162966 RepID=A0ABM8G9M1_9MICO|nr:hypothetical protein GCM10025866_08030 [Naasia aerilata]
MSDVGGSSSAPGIGSSSERTEDGNFLVRFGENGPILGLIHEAQAGYVCYPYTPEFPVMGPVERVEDAVQLCVDHTLRGGLSYA